jgi:hypothetical protein
VVVVNGALFRLIVDGTEQGIPVQVTAVDDRGLLILMMDQQVDEHRVLELEALGDMGGQIGEEIHDLGVVVLFADDPVTSRSASRWWLISLSSSLTISQNSKPEPGRRQPDGLERVVEIRITEIEQVAILAIRRGDQGLADILVIAPGKPLRIMTGQSPSKLASRLIPEIALGCRAANGMGRVRQVWGTAQSRKRVLIVLMLIQPLKTSGRIGSIATIIHSSVEGDRIPRYII